VSVDNGVKMMSFISMPKSSNIMNTNFGKIHQRISIWTVFTCCLFLTTSLVGAQERTWLFETAIKKRSLAQNLTVASITGVSGNGTVKLKGIEEMMIVNTLEYLHFVSVTSDLMVSGLNYGSDYSFNPVIAKVLDQQLLPDDGLLVEVEIEAFLEDQFISEVDMRSLVGRVLSGLTEQLKFNLQKNNYMISLSRYHLFLINLAPCRYICFEIQTSICNSSLSQIRHIARVFWNRIG